MNLYLNNLHSNMVRFIIVSIKVIPLSLDSFTFQYGQIYYYLNNLKYIRDNPNLHSNMVRFIIREIYAQGTAEDEFTFQYGQIYYRIVDWLKNEYKYIYIPIWLDLLSRS